MTRALLGRLRGPLLAAGLAMTVAGPAAAQTSGPMPRDIRFDPHIGAAAPLSVELADEAGRKVHLADYFHHDKPVILVMAYYECPMLCSMVLNGLTIGLKSTGLVPGQDFEVVVASIDPDDTPARATAKKASYMKLYDRPGAEQGMHFMVGPASDVRALAEAVGFRYEYDPVGHQFAHPAGVVILTPEGTISRYLYGVEIPPRDLRLSLVEAGRGAVGSAGDQLLLLCFHYDPAQGRYGKLALGAVRAGGAVTALLVVAWVAFSLRRSRPATPGGAAREGRQS